MSDEGDCFSGVTRDCDVLLWFSWLIPESHPWELNLGAVLICPGLSVVCSVGMQGSVDDVSVSRGCCG